MQTPLFSNNQFVNQTDMTNAFTVATGSVASNNVKLHTAGLVHQSALSLVINGLNITVTAPTPFGALFGNGVSASFVGNTNGIVTSTVVVDTSSYVPASGTTTYYLIATQSTVSQSAYQVVGPPVGHPDYNPNFAPYTAYLLTQDSMVFSVTTTVPDNSVNMNIAEFTLTAGQTTITALNTTGQLRAGAQLSRNGEVLPADLAPGAAAASIGQLGGGLRGTLPNPTLYLPGSGVGAGGYSGPITIQVNGQGLVTSLTEDANFTVPGNLNVNENVGVAGFTTLAGGANVPYAQNPNNPIPLGQLNSLIPQPKVPFSQFTNQTGNRGFGTTYTNNTGGPMYVSVCGGPVNAGANTTSVALYINATLVGVSEYSGGGGDGMNTIAGIIPNGSTYQLQSPAGNTYIASWTETY